MNLNILNKEMLSREIENEFYTHENSFKSLISIINKDISNNSSIVGISLFGSFESISKEIIKNHGIKKLKYNKISKYINYIIWNIEYLDLNKVDTNMIQFNEININNKIIKYNIPTIILYLYFYSLTSNNISLQKNMILVFKKLIEKTFNLFKTSDEKLKTIIDSLNEAFYFPAEKESHYTLWEMIFTNFFDNTFNNFQFLKNANEINKFDVNEVNNFYYSRIIKNIISLKIKQNISQIDNSFTSLNVNLTKWFKVRQNDLNLIINCCRNNKDYFTSSILTYYLNILNED